MLELERLSINEHSSMLFKRVDEKGIIALALCGCRSFVRCETKMRACIDSICKNTINEISVVI